MIGDHAAGARLLLHDVQSIVEIVARRCGNGFLLSSAGGVVLEAGGDRASDGDELIAAVPVVGVDAVVEQVAVIVVGQGRGTLQRQAVVRANNQSGSAMAQGPPLLPGLRPLVRANPGYACLLTNASTLRALPFSICQSVAFCYLDEMLHFIVVCTVKFKIFVSYQNTILAFVRHDIPLPVKRDH